MTEEQYRLLKLREQGLISEKEFEEAWAENEKTIAYNGWDNNK